VQGRSQVGVLSVVRVYSNMAFGLGRVRFGVGESALGCRLDGLCIGGMGFCKDCELEFSEMLLYSSTNIPPWPMSISPSLRRRLPTYLTCAIHGLAQRMSELGVT
jgi:hypothetical protein